MKNDLHPSVLAPLEIVVGPAVVNPEPKSWWPYGLLEFLPAPTGAWGITTLL